MLKLQEVRAERGRSVSVRSTKRRRARNCSVGRTFWYVVPLLTSKRQICLQMARKLTKLLLAEYLPNAQRPRLPLPYLRRPPRTPRLLGRLQSPGHVYPRPHDHRAGTSGVHGGDCEGIVANAASARGLWG